ncbi:hypothetical protein J3F80_001815 [Coemansia sp. RSA 2526]|nr:hypothetical protein J3F80_001815 [Coemansia sp. RSA 2526]
MDDHTPTSAADSFASELNLALQSPPPMLVQSPYGARSSGEFDTLSVSSSSMKRSRADIATPRKPGTQEARAQQDMEFINTPARAPSSMKRHMRTGSPVSRTLVEPNSGLDIPDVVDAVIVDSSPPRFALAQSDDQQMEVSRIVTSDEEVFGSPVAIKVLSPQTKLTLEATAAVDAMQIVSFEPTLAAPVADIVEDTVIAEADTQMMAMMAVDSAMAKADTQMMAVDPVEPSFSSLIVVETVSPEAIFQAALKASNSETASLTAVSVTPEPGVQAPVGRPQVVRARSERAELTTAKIFDDPELMNAASVPLPSTPSMDRKSVTPQKFDKKDPSDFFIPTDWLMDPGTVKRSGRQTDAPNTPLKQYSPTSNSDSLIPVTPANQKLLDSLEIQWVSPRQVPKFSQVDVDAIRAEYEDQIKRQNELREKLLQAVKEEYSVNMRKQEDKAEQLLKEAEDMFQAHLEHREQEFAKMLEDEQQRHLVEIARSEEERRMESYELTKDIDSFISERAEIIAERDDKQTKLDEYMARTSKVYEEKDAECTNLTHELGKMALDRQRLQKQLLDAVARAEALNEEKNDAQMRIEALTSENVHFEQLTSALRNDVLVAEERTSKIKEHAQGTLARANDEISSNHEQLTQSRHNEEALKAQLAKADARSRSLQIQFESMKRQNTELLELCEGL